MHSTLLSISFEQATSTISGWVWGPALIILCLGSALLFSVLTRFVHSNIFSISIYW